MTKQVLYQTAVTYLTINESNNHKNEVLVAFKNNKLAIIEFNMTTFDFVKESLSFPPLPDTPLTLAYLGTHIFYGKINIHLIKN